MDREVLRTGTGPAFEPWSDGAGTPTPGTSPTCARRSWRPARTTPSPGCSRMDRRQTVELDRHPAHLGRPGPVPAGGLPGPGLRAGEPDPGGQDAGHRPHLHHPPGAGLEEPPGPGRTWRRGWTSPAASRSGPTCTKPSRAGTPTPRRLLPAELDPRRVPAGLAGSPPTRRRCASSCSRPKRSAGSGRRSAAPPGTGSGPTRPCCAPVNPGSAELGRGAGPARRPHPGHHGAAAPGRRRRQAAAGHARRGPRAAERDGRTRWPARPWPASSRCMTGLTGSSVCGRGGSGSGCTCRRPSRAWRPAPATRRWR